ncbi:hypothetical protein IWX47DRAFT_589191 [Phyllosticta citricarpa]
MMSGQRLSWGYSMSKTSTRIVASSLGMPFFACRRYFDRSVRPLTTTARDAEKAISANYPRVSTRIGSFLQAYTLMLQLIYLGAIWSKLAMFKKNSTHLYFETIVIEALLMPASPRPSTKSSSSPLTSPIWHFLYGSPPFYGSFRVVPGPLRGPSGILGVFVRPGISSCVAILPTSQVSLRNRPCCFCSLRFIVGAYQMTFQAQ